MKNYNKKHKIKNKKLKIYILQKNQQIYQNKTILKV